MDARPPASQLGQRVADALHAAKLEPSRELAQAMNEIAVRMWAECTTPAQANEDEARAAEAQAIIDQLQGRAQP
jgi:hypothetical protein